MTLTEFIDAWIPPWFVVLVIYRWFNRGLIRLAGHYSTFLPKLLARGQGAASTILVIIALGFVPAIPARPATSAARSARS
jgi:hypothetical protein